MNASILDRYAHRVQSLGHPLRITLWDGRPIVRHRNPRVTVTVRTPKALRVLLDPSLGSFARHYVEQELDIDGDTRAALQMGEALAGAPGASRRFLSTLRGWLRHSRLFDRKAIEHHYDVDDEFFGLWLDDRRVYSCAYFRHADDTLDLAQEQKLDHICRKLRLQPGDRLLDIGCGWGALVRWAARRYRVRATGITLSRNQYEYARRRTREEGLGDCCEVRLLDYRDMPETERFDKIASIGMFEHVGRKNLPLYFGKIDRLLQPGGLVLNHGITLNAPDQDELGGDAGRFIDEYVFPGGELLHISRVLEAMSRRGLEPCDVEGLRPHYAKTLWHWVERLEANSAEVRARVGEKIFRIWRIYMAGSAHAFERGWLSIFQVLAAKPLADGRTRLPATRDHIYRDPWQPDETASAQTVLAARSVA